MTTGGGDNGGMEARVARLEAHIEHIQSDMADIKSTLTKLSEIVIRIDAKLDSKLDHKWLNKWLTVLTVSVLGIVAVILRSEITALFQ